MLTVVLPKKSTVQQKLQRAFQAGLQTPELLFAGILACVVYLSFFTAKNFLPLYALESEISILWVSFFTTQELIHPCEASLINSTVYLPVVSS